MRFPDFKIQQGPGGIPIYALPSGKPGLCYLELVFENGRRAESKPMTSRLVASQIQEGCDGLTQAEIVDFFDYHGCSYSIHSDLDFTIFSVSCLQKHFDRVFGTLLKMAFLPEFPEENLNKSRVFLKSQLAHQLMEPDFVSYREFTEHIYGKGNPYAYNSSAEWIDHMQREDLVLYHRRYFSSGQLKIFYSGEERTDSFWNDHLSIVPLFNGEHHLPEFPEINYGAPIDQHIEMVHCQQTSLKMGCGLFPKSHADYYPLYFINTLLGDYFGSRLMKNIREEEGLTYDIHSTVDVQLHAGCFYISAELNPEHREKSIDLIRDELRRLRTELVSDVELQMVKNYLNGHVLRMIDGPFQSILLLKILMTEFKDIRAFDHLIHTIRDINPKDILEVSERYLHEDRMSVVSAGLG